MNLCGSGLRHTEAGTKFNDTHVIFKFSEIIHHGELNRAIHLCDVCGHLHSSGVDFNIPL